MEKLIRDKVHTIPHPQYPNMHIRKVASIIEHITLLIVKITEETNEFEKATGTEKIEEAGDMLEAYDTLITLYGESDDIAEQTKIKNERELFLKRCSEDPSVNLATIFLIQNRKREIKGGFGKGIIWTNT